jgi:UDP-N-acetylglucosamine pyrophosphorylase
VSIKAVERSSAHEKMGILASYEENLRIIEYSEMEDSLLETHRFSLGHTGLYCFSFDFIESLLSGDISRSYEMLPDIVDAFTDQGLLLILLSQLHFLLVVTKCKESK